MIGIVDYGVGNVRSVQNMLQRSGIPAVVSGDPATVRIADRLILPGVGHFQHGMTSLRASGLVEVLTERVLEARVPILGICLGAQLFGRASEEGDCPGLNWVAMATVRFDGSRLLRGERLPHMGWAPTAHTGSALFAGMEGTPRFYYVHSYHFSCDDPATVTCTAEHGYRFAAGVAHRHIVGVQFHPEKSHVYGQQLLENFASMTFPE
jgi:glutamine amidotransferase